jgi:GT2 family glycosyltransferase
MAPAAAADPLLVAAVERWHTIPHCDYGPTVAEAPSLIGANMLVERRAFARVGLFDERLGPGAAGASEDTELAARLRAAGERIGYIPDAIVYHAVEPDRLSAAYFRSLHEARGRSRIYYNSPSGAPLRHHASAPARPRACRARRRRDCARQRRRGAPASARPLVSLPRHARGGTRASPPWRRADPRRSLSRGAVRAGVRRATAWARRARR